MRVRRTGILCLLGRADFDINFLDVEFGPRDLRFDFKVGSPAFGSPWLEEDPVGEPDSVEEIASVEGIVVA